MRLAIISDGQLAIPVQRNQNDQNPIVGVEAGGEKHVIAIVGWEMPDPSGQMIPKYGMVSGLYPNSNVTDPYPCVYHPSLFGQDYNNDGVYHSTISEAVEAIYSDFPDALFYVSEGTTYASKIQDMLVWLSSPIEEQIG